MYATFCLMCEKVYDDVSARYLEGMEGKPRFRFRKLQIAWSVAWGVVAVLFIALWVASYVRECVYNGPLGQKHCITWYSQRGQFLIWIVPWGGTSPDRSDFILAPYGAPDGVYADRTGQEILMMLGFDPTAPRTLERVDNNSVVCAYWIPTLLAVVVGAAPWALRRRFSLRTLLIAITLTAVTLGMILYRLRTKPVPHPQVGRESSRDRAKSQYSVRCRHAQKIIS
jgi:hypothetical protein